MKYIIEDYFEFTYNALSKARKDVTSFVLKNGYKSVWKINREEKVMQNGLYRKFNYFLMMARLLFVKKKSVLFFQTLSILKKFQSLKIHKIKKIRSVFLIHDLLWLRYNTDESIRAHRNEIDADIAILNQCDYIITHNERMSAKLRELGCKTEMRELEIFDYATDKPAKKRTLKDGETIEITYAGDIKKSNFLLELDKQKHNYHFNIYGQTDLKFENLDYKGCVDANDLPAVIEGHFGVIWDEKYTTVYTDNYGLLNNPHKLSMYIVSGLPVIVWEQSAAAVFVKKYKIGITINQLSDLENIQTRVSPDLYNELVNNCDKIRNSLINGEHIKKVLI